MDSTASPNLSRTTSRRFARGTLALTTLLALALTARAADVPALLDDFSQPDLTQASTPRLLVDDSTLGGKSHATQRCADGVLLVEGKLSPGRGSPAFISVPLLLTPTGEPQDLTGYEGLRLRVRVAKGNLSVQVSSAEIDNFDYHTSAPLVRKPEAFQEVRIPFATLKRAWSEQTPLNLRTITSVNFVAAGMAPDEFSYAVDEIGFY